MKTKSFSECTDEELKNILHQLGRVIRCVRYTEAEVRSELYHRYAQRRK